MIVKIGRSVLETRAHGIYLNGILVELVEPERVDIMADFRRIAGNVAYSEAKQEEVRRFNHRRKS